MSWDGLPGAEWIADGVKDPSAGRETDAALLVSIGRPRLERLGIHVPAAAASEISPEHRLYLRLAETDPDGAHSRDNAFIRRLVSFERAAACVA